MPVSVLELPEAEVKGANIASCSKSGYCEAWCFQVDIYITPGAHSTEAAVNKQLNDKERVAAALENPNLLDMVNKCLIST